MITPDDLDKAQLKTLVALQSIFKTIPAHKILEVYCKEVEHARRLYSHWQEKGE